MDLLSLMNLPFFPFANLFTVPLSLAFQKER